MRRARLPARLAWLVALTAGVAGPAQAGWEPDAAERLDGPSRMDALLGNGRLTVGLSADGVVTVLRWPSPSFHDQVHHVTARQPAGGPEPRSLPRMGAAATDGMFLGLVVDRGGGPEVVALGEGGVRLAGAGYASDTSRVARWTGVAAGVEFTQEAWVLPSRDVLVMHLEVTPLLPAVALGAFLFAHAAPTARKVEAWPVADFWMDDPNHPDSNGFAAAWLPGADALVALAPHPWWRAEAGRAAWAVALQDPHGAPGGADLVEAVTPYAGVALAVACDRPVTTQVGSWDDGRGQVLPLDARADLEDGVLSGHGAVLGDATWAMLAPLPPSGVSQVTFLVAVSEGPPGALALLSSTRSEPVAQLRDESESAADAITRDVATPDTDDARVRALALRALVSLELLTDAATGAVVASASTQPPWGVDRPTDAALVDVALAHGGRLWAAARHRRLWASWQRTVHDGSGPAGSWPGGFYADGELGSVVGWPLDGLALSVWAHGRVMERALTTVELGDPVGALAGIRESALAAAAVLLACVDEERGLPCAADEWDRPARSSGVWQVASVVVGLREAARFLGASGEHEREQQARALAERYLASLEGLVLGDPGAPLHGVALALGSAGALRARPEARGAALDRALGRLGDFLDGQAGGLFAPTVVLWQLLVATAGDAARRVRAEEALDRFLARGPTPFHHVGLASYPVSAGAAGAPPLLDQRLGAPNAAAEAALFLALLERHGRRPPPSLPLPELNGCACPGRGDAGRGPDWPGLGLLVVGACGLGCARRRGRGSRCLPGDAETMVAPISPPGGGDP